VSELDERDIRILSHYAERGNRELYWNYLAQRPGADGYGVLALGVVRNDNMPGATANHFADAQARRDGVNMTERDWNRFGVDLMRRDLQARQEHLENGRPAQALNLSAADVMRVHDDAFRNAGISPNAWTPREYLQAARRDGERDAGPQATPAQRQAAGNREMEGAWDMMLNNVRLGADRGAQTMWGTAVGYNDQQMRAADYTGRMAGAYLRASVDRANTDPDRIGAQSLYHERQRDGRWLLISEGHTHGPVFLSPGEMNSEHLERNPARIRELEDTRNLRLHIRELRDDFHEQDPHRNILRSPRTLAEASPPAEERRFATAPDQPAAEPAAVRVAAAAPLLDDAVHRNHEMYARLLRTVHEREEQMNLPRSQVSVEVAGGLTEAACRRGLSQVGFAQFTPDGRAVAMTDTPDPTSPWARTAVAQVGGLVGQSLEQSSENVDRINRQQALDAPPQTPPVQARSADQPQQAAHRIG
jgi:hypothetical protein